MNENTDGTATDFGFSGGITFGGGQPVAGGVSATVSAGCPGCQQQVVSNLPIIMIGIVVLVLVLR